MTSTESSSATTGDRKVPTPSHTAGPWFVVEEECDLWVEAENDLAICRITGAKPTKRDYADADLIAAAPDLLAKCQKVVAWLDHLADTAAHAGKDTRFKSLSDAYKADAANYRKTADDVRTAIAKATGATQGSPVVTLPSNEEAVVP